MTYDQWKTTEPESGYDAPVEPTEADDRDDYLDENAVRLRRHPAGSRR